MSLLSVKNRVKITLSALLTLTMIASLITLAPPASANSPTLGMSFGTLNPADGWSSNFVPGSTSYWRTGGKTAPSYPNLDESKVFYGSLTHTDTDPNREWQVRLGKGSQIYSIITKHGEVMASQANDCPSMHYWNDSVLQMTWRPHNQPRRDGAHSQCAGGGWLYNKNGDIHQAGTYQTDGLSTSHFSPIVFSDTTPNEVTTIAWPQAAHAPTNYESGVMIEQTVSDEGQGIVKIETRTHNFGDEPYQPGLWSMFNGRMFGQEPGVTGKTPNVWTSITANGGAPQALPCTPALGCTVKMGPSDLHINGNFGGVIGLARPETNPAVIDDGSKAWGMAIALGTDIAPRVPTAPHIPGLRVGKWAGRKIALTAAIDEVLAPGQSQTFTYYLVFDRMDLAMAKAGALVANGSAGAVTTTTAPTAGKNSLVEHASTIGNFDNVRRVPACFASFRGAGWADCNGLHGNGGIQRAAAFNQPVTRAGLTAKPVFVLRQGAQYYLTTDPYGRDNPAFSAAQSYNGQPVLRPYRGAEMMHLFGYAFEGMPASGCYRKLDGVEIANVQIQPNLYVPVHWQCP